MKRDRAQHIPNDYECSRRTFLGVAASVVGGAACKASSANTDEALTMPPGVPRSRVVQVGSRHVVAGSTVHRLLLGEMIEAALKAVTQRRDAAEAWRSILKPDDVIGIKFNQSGQRVIGTTPSFADVLVNSLVSSGWQPDQIVCIEASASFELGLATAVPAIGWDKVETDFGSGSDQLASVLRQVTAIIDVPFLKTHNIAGITCALKNLSHGLVKHPARYHGNGCSPYIPDIVASEPISSKLRLCLVDALRVVFYGGPEAHETSTVGEGIILASLDPVAVDATAVGLLNQVRLRNGLTRIARSPEDLRYLAAAHRRGLGIALNHGIDVVKLNGT